MLLRIVITDADIAAMIKTPEAARSVVWRHGIYPGQETEFLDCWASAVCNGAGELIGICALYSRNRDKITNWPQKIVAACVPSCAAIIERGRARQKMTVLTDLILTGLLNRFAITEIMQNMVSPHTSSSFAYLFWMSIIFRISTIFRIRQWRPSIKKNREIIVSQCRSNFTTGSWRRIISWSSSPMRIKRQSRHL
jgi:hypothetical protein